MMILKGDFQKYDSAAASVALQCLAPNVSDALELIPDLVYEMVIRRMYQNLGRIILQQQYPEKKMFFQNEYLTPMLDCFYTQAKASTEHPESISRDAILSLSTPLPLIGVGAPIHVFLPRVAKLLHTRAIVPEYAGVANALGAATSRKVTRCDLTVKVEYDGLTFMGYSVFENGKKHLSKNRDKMVALGKEILTHNIRKRALLQGLGDNPHIEISMVENRIGHTSDGILLEINLHGTAATF